MGGLVLSTGPFVPRGLRRPCATRTAGRCRRVPRGHPRRRACAPKATLDGPGVGPSLRPAAQKGVAPRLRERAGAPGQRHRGDAHARDGALQAAFTLAIRIGAGGSTLRRNPSLARQTGAKFRMTLAPALRPVLGDARPLQGPKVVTPRSQNVCSQAVGMPALGGRFGESARGPFFSV